MIEEVRDRTQDLIRDACESEDPVLIEAPPASGKTYTAIRLAAQGYKILYLAGRTDLYAQAKDEVENLKNKKGGNDITAETIPSPNRHCETFQDNNSGDTRKAKRLYAKGVSGKELHTKRNEVSMPCHTEESPCEYVDKRNRLNENPEEIDILIGNHQHAYNPRYLLNRIVIFDEFNPGPFIESFPSGDSNILDAPHELVSGFLQAVDELPLDNITDLIEARAREDEDYTASLDWFYENEANEQTVKKFHEITAYPYNTAHKLSALLTASLLVMEKVGSDMELAYNPDLWDELGVKLKTRCVRDRSSGKMFVIDPPPLEKAQQVIGLDATPVKRMWNVVFGCKFDKNQVIERSNIDRYLKEGLEIDVIQVSESRLPYSGGRISSRDQQRFALVRNIENQKFPVISRKRALERYQSRDWFRKCVESAENNDQEYRVQNYGSVLSSNRFKDDSLGFISGSPYPGDDVVKKWCALCGESAQPIRSEDENSRTKLEFNTDIGETIYRHFTHNLVFQAILRFGRTPSESVNRSTVYVNTNTLPEWISPRQLTIDNWFNATKRVAIVEALIRASKSNEKQSWQTVGTIVDSVEDRLKATENDEDSVSGEYVREVLREDINDCIERDPRSGLNGADRFRWDGEEELKQTVGIFKPADDLLVTDNRAMFLKVFNNNSK